MAPVHSWLHCLRPKRKPRPPVERAPPDKPTEMAPSAGEMNKPAAGEYSLCGLPDELLLLIFRAFAPACAFDGHATFRASAALGGTCRRLRRVRRQSLRAVALRAEDTHFSTDDVRSLVLLATPSLRSLEIARPWACIASPLASLSASPPRTLRSLTLSQLTSRANLHPDALVSALRALGPRLETLDVSYMYPVGHLHAVLEAVGDVCCRLKNLSLENLWVPTHMLGQEHVFKRAWARLGSSLRTLRLLRAQENLLDAAFVRILAGLCPRLEEFAADGAAFASPYVLSEVLGVHLGARLRSLEVRNAALCDMDAATLLSRCPRLTTIALVGTAVSGATLRRLVDLLGPRLQSVELTHVADLADEDVAALALSALSLTRLRLRGCVKLTDRALPSALCRRLVALDVRDCPRIGNKTLRRLAARPAPLREIVINEGGFSEEAIAGLLWRCGGTLVEVDMRFKLSANAPDRKRLRQMLALYCRSGVLQRAVLD